MNLSRIVLISAVLVGGPPSLTTAESPKSKSRLVRILTGRSESVRVKTLANLQGDTHQLRESLGDLIDATKVQAKALKESDLPPSIVQMINMIASVDTPESEAALIELLESPNVDLAMSCADALGRNKFYGAIDSLQRQIDRPEFDGRYGFRFNLVRSLALMRHPDAIEILGQLESKLDGQLRFEIGKILAEVTLDDFRGDQKRYEAWKNRAGGIFRAAKFDPDANQEASYSSYNPIRFGQPQYYGIEIRAQRVLFVLDHSGSMRKMTNYGSRLLRAKQELIKAITELPEDAEFAIVSFDTNIRQWRDHLSPATEDDKRSAILYVQRLKYGDATNTYGALRRALDFDDNLEAVFLLTDGKPTRGQIVNPSQIAGDIIYRNRWRHLNINTIGISVGGPTESFLRSLAENSGGEFREAN